jgi:hypothetical protein
MHLDIFDDRFGSIERIANTPAAIAAALARWQRADTRVIFEATGSYDRVLRRALEAAYRLRPRQPRPRPRLRSRHLDVGQDRCHRRRAQGPG